MSCPCLRCRTLRKMEVAHNPNWDGFMKVDLFIGGNEGEQLQVATLSIQVSPLLVDPKVVNRVMAEASKSLSKAVANFAKGKTVN